MNIDGKTMVMPAEGSIFDTRKRAWERFLGVVAEEKLMQESYLTWHGRAQDDSNCVEPGMELTMMLRLRGGMVEEDFEFPTPQDVTCFIGKKQLRRTKRVYYGEAGELYAEFDEEMIGAEMIGKCKRDAKEWLDELFQCSNEGVYTHDDKPYWKMQKLPSKCSRDERAIGMPNLVMVYSHNAQGICSLGVHQSIQRQTTWACFCIRRWRRHSGSEDFGTSEIYTYRQGRLQKK